MLLHTYKYYCLNNLFVYLALLLQLLFCYLMRLSLLFQKYHLYYFQILHHLLLLLLEYCLHLFHLPSDELLHFLLLEVNSSIVLLFALLFLNHSAKVRHKTTRNARVFPKR